MLTYWDVCLEGGRALRKIAESLNRPSTRRVEATIEAAIRKKRIPPSEVRLKSSSEAFGVGALRFFAEQNRSGRVRQRRRKRTLDSNQRYAINLYAMNLRTFARARPCVDLGERLSYRGL